MTSEELGRSVRADGKRLVFTNGCFDVIHAGHIRLLSAARAEGDYLVVGLNSDSSVKRLKGESRPVMNQSDRREILLAIRSVDAVEIFDEDTPLALILALRPDVLVKGADYAEDEIVGSREVKSWGGRVVRVQLLPGRSTTAVLEAL